MVDYEAIKSIIKDEEQQRVGLRIAWDAMDEVKKKYKNM